MTDRTILIAPAIGPCSTCRYQLVDDFGGHVCAFTPLMPPCPGGCAQWHPQPTVNIYGYHPDRGERPRPQTRECWHVDQPVGVNYRIDRSYEAGGETHIVEVTVWDEP